MRLFGLIGYPLSHSFSEKYFSKKFIKEGITDCRYSLFPLRTIEELFSLLKNLPELEGLNVTIPYKKQVLAFLDNSHIPAGVDACNCINVVNGGLVGYNTDITGFEISIKPLVKSWHKKALVLGNGGSASAVLFVLKKMNIEFNIVSRTIHDNSTMVYSDITPEMMKEHKIVINTTPLGMLPDMDTCPQIPYKYVTEEHLFYDLVYNPAKTIFLQKGEEQGATIKNGEEMLELQAEESWRIWNE